MDKPRLKALKELLFNDRILELDSFVVLVEDYVRAHPEDGQARQLMHLVWDVQSWLFDAVNRVKEAEYGKGSNSNEGNEIGADPIGRSDL